MTSMQESPASSQSNAPRQSEVRSAWPIYLVAVVVAGLVAGVIGYSFVGESLVALGIPDPGPVTTFGLPFFRAAAWILSALSIGSFLFSSFYISPRENGPDNSRMSQAPLTVDGHIAARTGAVAALLFAVIGLVMVPMVLSDVSGTPFAQSLDPTSWAIALEQVATSQVWLVCSVIATVTGVAGLVFHRWGAQPVLLLGSVLMIVPLGMEGHAATGGAHDYGTNAYLWHLVFMAVWIGGLFALIAHGRRLGPDLQTAVRRYSTVALFSIVAVALSGVVSMVIRIQVTDLLTTRYGLIITAKIVGTIVLALFGFWHRQVTIPQLGNRNGAFLRLAIGEVMVMAAVAGIAVTMGRTPPPPPLDPDLSPMEIQLGYELFVEPSYFNVFGMWRFEVLYGVIAILLAIFYLLGVRSARRRGKEWKSSYTAWWLLGCVSLFVTVSSGIGMNMPASYSVHMLGHMVLSMVVPLFMAMGAPLTLVMTVWEPGDPGKPTPHDWAKSFCSTRFVDIITIPWVNLLQFLFVFYVMYLYIPLYELAISEHAGHVIMNAAFLVSGYFYFWELVGPDPVPHRRPASIRLVWLFISMPVHLFLGVYLMMLTVVMGQEFYLSLELPWNPDLLADQREGGGIAWALGSFPLTFVFILLFLEWRSDEKLHERVVDERLDAAAQRHATGAVTSDSGSSPATPVEESQGADAYAPRATGLVTLNDGRITQWSGAEADRVDDADETDTSDDLDAYNAMLRRYHEGRGSAVEDYYARQFRGKKQ